MRSLHSLALLASLSLPFIAGCSFTSPDSTTSSVDIDGLSGDVHGGRQPISLATIKVWQVGASSYGAGATVLQTTATDASGHFQVPAYTCTYANAPVYLTAQGGNSGGGGTNANIMLAAGLGPCSTAQSRNVNINEITTAVTAYALGQFFTTTLGSGSLDNFGGTAPGSGVFNKGLVTANTYTIPTLVQLSTGTVNSNTSTVTIEAAKINSIANALAACVNTTGETNITETTTACGKLFADTKPPTGSTRPYDTLQAAVQMAIYPYQNVNAIYTLAVATPPYVGLSTTPNDWTLGVSYTTSALGLGINGNGNLRTGVQIDVDTSGKVWFPSTKPGASGIANFDPASTSFNGPYQGTRLIHPQFVQVDQVGTVWASDLASNSFVGISSTTPSSFTAFNLTGASATTAFGIDYDDTIDMLYTRTSDSSSRYGSIPPARSSITDKGAGFTSGNLATGVVAQAFSIWAAANGSNTACNLETVAQNANNDGSAANTSASGCIAGGITQVINGDDFLIVASNLGQYCSYQVLCVAFPMPVSSPEGIVTDGTNNEWLANSGNASVSTMSGYDNDNFINNYVQTSPIAYLHNSANGNTMTTPYAITADASGNLWILNAGCISTNGSACTPTSLVLSELIGAAGPTIVPLSAQQTAISGGGVNDYQGFRPTN